MTVLGVRPLTKILVDGGDPDETLRVRNLLGFVDGQTTNPTFVAKNPERWGNLIKPYPYLEDHWAEWAPFEQRLELVRQKFGNSPGILEFIDKLQSFTAQLDTQTFGISFSCGLRSLISAIVRECPRGSPRNELIALMKVRYGHAMNIGKYVRNLDERTQHLIGRMGEMGSQADSREALAVLR